MSARDFLFRGFGFFPLAPAQFCASAPAATGRKKMIKNQDEEASSHDFLFALVFFPLHQFGGFTALSYTCIAFEGSIAVLVLADFATKLAASWVHGRSAIKKDVYVS
jgi:hypothetical protein